MNKYGCNRIGKSVNPEVLASQPKKFTTLETEIMMKLTIVAVIALVAFCSGKQITLWGEISSEAHLDVVTVEKLANPYNFHNIHLYYPKEGESNNRTIVGIRQYDYVHPANKVELIEGGPGFKNATITIFAPCGVEVNSTFIFYLV